MPPPPPPNAIDSKLDPLNPLLPRLLAAAATASAQAQTGAQGTEATVQAHRRGGSVTEGRPRRRRANPEPGPAETGGPARGYTSAKGHRCSRTAEQPRQHHDDRTTAGRTSVTGPGARAVAEIPWRISRLAGDLCQAGPV